MCRERASRVMAGIAALGRLLSTLEERLSLSTYGEFQVTCGVDCEVQPLD